MQSRKAIEHVENVLEVMRGKTVVQTLTVHHSGGTDAISFQADFESYLRWNYGGRVEGFQGIQSVRIEAHQLFSEKSNGFSIVFSEGLQIEGINRMEESLFLDLKRYCEHASLDLKSWDL